MSIDWEAIKAFVIVIGSALLITKFILKMAGTSLFDGGKDFIKFILSKDK